MSNFPTQLDDDSTLPSVIDGATETGGEAINALKGAVLAIEAAIGADPQGSLSTLVQRIAVSLNDDGTLKSSALLAAGLISLPIANSQISPSAAIAESKLDLDYATTALYNAIISNDIDIGALQDAVLSLLGNFAEHVAGDDFNHDGFGILLDNNNPGTPPWLTGFTASTVSDALAAIVAEYNSHTAVNAAGAHLAVNIAVAPLSTITSTNLQDVLADLEDYRAVELRTHRDDLHANGISAWENDSAGWNTQLQRVPSSGTASALAITETILDFSPLDVSAAGVTLGDVFVVAGDGYTISRAGPSSGYGSLLSLTSTQIEIVGGVTQGLTYSAAVFAKSSVSNLRVGLAPAIIPGNSTVDTIQFARPNAAKLVSLGIYAEMVSATDSLTVEVGVGGSTRSVTITNLHRDRTGLVTITPTLQSICERINYVALGGAEGNFVPFAAYVIGGEIALVHNWSDSVDYTIEITAAAGEIERAFDNAGNIALASIPTISNVFMVDGVRHSDFLSQFSGPTTVSGATLSAVAVDFSALGVVAGQLVHVTSASVASEIGSYQITAVGSNTFSVDTVLTSTSATVRIDGSSVGLFEFDGATNASIVELFVNRDGRTGRSVRATYTDSISGVKIVSVGDSLRAGTNPFTVTSNGADRIFRFSSNVDQSPRTVLNTFTGRLQLFSSTNVDWIEVEATNPIGTGTATVAVFPHIDEEDLFELAQIRLSGRTIESVSDRRLFGSTGLDEIREDVVQAYVETPLAELRSDGAVRGFSILDDDIDMQALQGYAAGVRGLLIDGGIAYIDGVRVVQSTQYVPIPAVNGTYIVGITNNATFKVLDASVYPLSDILEGLVGSFFPIAQSVRTAVPAITSVSLVTYISNLDSRVDAVLDLTNNFTGSFASTAAAIAYLNSYPDNEKRRLRVVSDTASTLDFSTLTAELDLSIEGAIGTLTSSQDLVVSGVISAGRTAPHIGTLNFSATNGIFRDLILETVTIDPALVSGATYRFKDCVFTDLVFDLQDAGGNVSEISFEDCLFNGTAMTFAINSSAIGACKIRFSRCRAEVPGEFVLAASEALLERVVFDETTVHWNVATSDSFVDILDCEFLNHTVGVGQYVYKADLGITNMRGVFVDGLTVTGIASAFDLDALRKNVCNDIFVNSVTVSHTTPSSTPFLISGGEITVVSGVQIAGGSTVSIPAITANDVSFLQYDPQGTNITRVDANFVSECRGLRVVRPLQALEPLVISKCNFVGTSVAPSLVWSDDLRVTDCYFDVSTTGIGIGAADTTSRNGVSVSGCIFAPGTGNSLDFGSILSVDGTISNCSVGTSLVTNSANLADIRFSDCAFLSANQLSLGAGGGFFGCTSADFVFTISGAPTDLTVSDWSGDLTILANTTSSVLSVFRGDLVLFGTQTDFRLSNMTGSLQNSGSVTVSGLFSDVSLDSASDLAGFTFSDMFFTNCIFAAATLTCDISSNVKFNSGSIKNLTVASNVSGLGFNGMVAGTIGAEVTINGTTSSATLVGNDGISFYFNDTASNINISGGYCPELGFDGIIAGAIISGVRTDSMLIGGSGSTSATNILLSNCSGTSLALFDNYAGANITYSGEISACTFGTLQIFPDGEPGGTIDANLKILGGQTILYYDGTVTADVTTLNDKGIFLFGAKISLSYASLSTPPYTVYKQADQTTSSITPVFDDHLSLLVGDGVYSFQLFASVNPSSTETLKGVFHTSTGSMDITYTKTSTFGADRATHETSVVGNSAVDILECADGGAGEALVATGTVSFSGTSILNLFSLKWYSQGGAAVTIKKYSFLKLEPLVK